MISKKQRLIQGAVEHGLDEATVLLNNNENQFNVLRQNNLYYRISSPLATFCFTMDFRERLTDFQNGQGNDTYEVLRKDALTITDNFLDRVDSSMISSLHNPQMDPTIRMPT
ncbi:unnamed protein product [Ambrosiozyma monospora]|uniref:Unnamed protein product n=1 Tax=Ambrosiozyma monospora TaxID=43982 RepID=A0ACB5SV14_AMBMO|nr:unnamed protein product [Ambrosiozyma monospora]